MCQNGFRQLDITVQRCMKQHGKAVYPQTSGRRWIVLQEERHILPAAEHGSSTDGERRSLSQEVFGDPDIRELLKRLAQE